MKLHARLATGLAALVAIAVPVAASAAATAARPAPLVADAAQSRVLCGGPAPGAKAAGDTTRLFGGPGTLAGKFQTTMAGGQPDRQGWAGVDLTRKTVVRWNIDPFNAANLDATTVPNLAMWCGALFTPCNANDPPQGYGNNWDEYLDWYGTVANNTVPTTVRLTAALNNDSEPGYDFLNLQVERSTGMTTLLSWSSTTVNHGVAVDQTFSVAVSDYVGSGHNEVHLRWQATADTGYSDEDCLYPSSGHSQIDDITVSFNGVPQAYDDFQPGSPVHWTVAFPPSVGDFSKAWPRLNDIDPCHGNGTPVFAFIDDGVVVPGTGGTLGTTWTYGPSGYAVNHFGGLAGPAFHLDNEIWSPPIAWNDAQATGAMLSFDVYRHLPWYTEMVYKWRVRGSTDGGGTWSAWRDRGLTYYSNTPEWYRQREDITDLLPPGRTQVQVALGVAESGWSWGWDSDTTPAPYFDNIQLLAYRLPGPAIAVSEVDVFQDAFPASGLLDYANLGANSVRLDVARNVALTGAGYVDPGDSLSADVTAVRAGAVLAGPPELHVRLHANPLFDPYRTLPPGFTRSGRLIGGMVTGDSTFAYGAALPGRWHFDLPDTGFFFPGDELHWFVWARDNVAGDVGETCLPADTSGYAAFPGTAGFVALRYPSACTVRALPSLTAATAGAQPRVLLWDDSGPAGGAPEWTGALTNLGYGLGTDYDLYTTQAPTSGLGNGLGGRARWPQLAGYRTLLYTSGDLSSFTLGTGAAFGDPGPDVALLNTWLASGARNLFATGNDFEYDLGRGGAEAAAFRDKWLAVTHNAYDVRPLIGTQTTPLVKPIAGNAVGLADDFVAYGGCTPMKNFNAVTATGTGVRIAEYTNATGFGGVYPYASLVYNSVTANTARVIWSPIDFRFWYSPPGMTGLPARVRLLDRILQFFGEGYSGLPTGAPPAAGALAARAYPNPFNPRVRIAFELPRAGEARLAIYDVRGALVTTLVTGALAAGPHEAVWDGRDDRGRDAASGVYFYALRAGGEERLGKLVLVK